MLFDLRFCFSSIRRIESPNKGSKFRSYCSRQKSQLHWFVVALCLLSHIFISHFTCVENIPTCNRLAVKCMGTGNMSYPFQSCWLFVWYANASCTSHNITFRFTFGFVNCFPKSFTNVSKLLHLFSWFVRVALNEAHEWNKCQCSAIFKSTFSVQFMN